MSDDIVVYNLETQVSDKETVYNLSSSDSSSSSSSSTDNTTTSSSSNRTSKSGLSESEVETLIKQTLLNYNGILRVGSVASNEAFIVDTDGIRLGGTEPTAAVFRVEKDGTLTASSATITGAITATSGAITGSVTVGSVSGGYILIDGSNKLIKSSNYVAGSVGWMVDYLGNAEFENVIIRGSLKTTVFEKDVVSAVGGQVIVTNADVLDSDMTALDASTLTISGESSFSVNDILLIKDGVDTEYLRVTSVASAPTYSVTRDLAGAYSANTNPAWKTGTAVVVQGSSDGASTYSGGYLRMIGSGTNSPRYSVFKRTGAAYNAVTEYIGLGNLNGLLDYVADEYGIAIGTTDAYMAYDPTNGLRVAGNILPQIKKTAGETLAVGDFAVLRMGELVKQVASHDAIVKEGSAGTNFGTDTTAAMGSLNTLGTNDQYFFVKFDLSTIAIATADKAFVRIGITSPQTGSWGDDLEVRVYQVTGADWDESTITWTNMPAISASASDEYQTSSGDAFTDDFIEESAAQAYIFVDITTLYNQWKAGSASNYGVCFRFVRRSTGTEHTTASRNITVATSENATSALQPTIIVAGVSDNVGKFYKGNSTTFTDLIGPGGFVKVGGAAGATVTVQRDGLITGLSSLTQGKTHYINDSEALSTTNGTLIRDVGYALSTSELYYFDQPPRMFVNNIRYQQSNGSSNRCDCTNRYFIPCGFKPKIIRFMGTAKIKSTVRAGFGTYQNGVQSTNTDNLLTSGYLIYYSPSGSEIAYLDVISVSETGVLIEVRQTDISGSASAASIVIEGMLTFEL